VAGLYSQPALPAFFHQASIAHRADAEYAEVAKSAGLQGTAIVFVELDALGAVENAAIVQGLGLGLDEKAIEAAKRFTFNAASENGRPSRGEVVVEVPFRIPGTVWGVRSAAYRVLPPSDHIVKSKPVKPVLRQYVTPSAEPCQGSSGVASLAFDIGPDGVPSNVRPLEPLYVQPATTAIDAAAVEAVQAWRFDPGTLDGTATLSKASVDLVCGEAVAPGAISRVGGGVTKPDLVYRTEPEYSVEARASKLQGEVMLYLVVDPTGHPINISIMKGLGLGLDEKAVESVLQWRFRPGTKDGAPVAIVATVSVNFRLL